MGLAFWNSSWLQQFWEYGIRSFVASALWLGDDWICADHVNKGLIIRFSYGQNFGLKIERNVQKIGLNEVCFSCYFQVVLVKYGDDILLDKFDSMTTFT